MNYNIDTYDNEETICPICMNNIIDHNNIAITPCGHKFCFNCIIDSLQTIYTCPCCRTYLLIDEFDDTEDEPPITIKERIILYLQNIYNEGLSNSELLYIIIIILSYQNYYSNNYFNTINNIINNTINDSINNFMKNHTLLSQCYYIGLNYNTSFNL